MSSTSPQPRSEVRRALVRTAVAVLFAVLTLAALLEPAWVEATSGVDPDGGSGALEWALALGAGAATLATSVGAGLAWRRVAVGAGT